MAVEDREAGLPRLDRAEAVVRPLRPHQALQEHQGLVSHHRLGEAHLTEAEAKNHLQKA